MMEWYEWIAVLVLVIASFALGIIQTIAYILLKIHEATIGRLLEFIEWHLP